MCNLRCSNTATQTNSGDQTTDVSIGGGGSMKNRRQFPSILLRTATSNGRKESEVVK